MTTHENRLLNITGGLNFRELGGYKTTTGKTVKWHKVIRTGSLANLTTDDQSHLVNYGIRLDVDFRSRAEVSAAPDQIPSEITYRHLPVFSEDETDNSKSNQQIKNELGMTEKTGHDEMLKVYRNMVLDQQSKDAYKTFFQSLLTMGETDNGVLFHCTAGKDRTGMGAALFLGALDVNLDVIKKDYLMTNQLTTDYVANRLEEARQDGLSDELVDSVRALITVSEDYFDEGLATLEKNYGSFANYLKEALELSSTDVRDLKRLYLDD